MTIYYALIIPSTSSLFASIISLVLASRFNLNFGSVFEPRTLNQKSGYSMVMPSSLFSLASEYFSIKALMTASLSFTVELISPEWKYFL